MPDPPVDPASVFINIPYDESFQPIFLAYIAGIAALGLKPHATLAIPGGARRLDRIFDLIRSCRYSIHDLSRVELDPAHPPTPRFNMPFELGMAVAWSQLRPGQHTWFVCESLDRRALKSISDLNGTDFNIHSGTPEGVMRELRNMFFRNQDMPSVPKMMAVHQKLTRIIPPLLKDAASGTVFTAALFAELATAATLAL